MKIIAILLTLIFSSVCLANVGVFTGFGHSIELTKTKSVQMVSEEITIIPGRGRFLFDGGVGGMDRVEFICKFTLKNLTDKEIAINAGFPLNSQFLNPPYDKKQNSMELVSRYNFIAQTKDKQYSVKYSAGDKEKKLKNLFLWNMSFKPNETKILNVTYSMPISMTLASTAKVYADSKKYTKPWMKELEGCMLEYFGYVTITGNSWSGSIDNATFKIYVKGFEDYLMQRSMTEGLTKEQKKKNRYGARPCIVRDFSTDKWKVDENGFFTLTFENYKPKENLMFSYFLVSLPKTIEDVNSVLEKFKAKEYTAEDYQDYADILREYNGSITNNIRIKKFLDNQIWYGKKNIDPIPTEVIEYIISEKALLPKE